MMISFGRVFTFIIAVSSIMACRGMAQDYSIVYNFGFNGTEPLAGLLLSGDTLYGTAPFGDPGGNGSVFRINTDGTAFTNLYGFSASSDETQTGTNSDGAVPVAGLILSGNTLYGTTEYGGASASGAVFSINTDGSGFRTVRNFNGRDGNQPKSALVLSGNTLYGTTYIGGARGYGTVFAVNTDGTGFTNLYSFDGNSGDGGSPIGGLILSGKVLYGTTSGDSSYATVFCIHTDGTSFKNLHTFNGNTDGLEPYGGLVLSGYTLYGTTAEGGVWGDGTVFAININGTGFTNLYSFNPANNGGVTPFAGLVLSGHTLYGTTKNSGNNVKGTVFAINTDGTGFKNLHTFAGYPDDGSTPEAGLVFSNNILYGTAYFGGSMDCGVIFRISLPVPPPLTMDRSDRNIVLTWPTNNGEFVLQSCTNLSSGAGWNTVSLVPSLVSGQNAVTNAISGTQMFYRLSP